MNDFADRRDSGVIAKLTRVGSQYGLGASLTCADGRPRALRLTAMVKMHTTTCLRALHLLRPKVE